MSSIALHIESDMLARNLTALLTQMGIQVAADAPTALTMNGNQWQLTQGERHETLALPVHPARLLEAIHTISQPAPLSPLANGWMFDMLLRSISREEISIPLTEKEAGLLQALLQAAPELVSREALLKQVWAYETDLETHTLETHIYRLRQKLETGTPTPCSIETIEGSYRLVLDMPLF